MKEKALGCVSSFLLALLVLFTALIVEGCGYRMEHMAQHDISHRNVGKRIAVPLFENLTFEPLLERQTVDAVKEELMVQGWVPVNHPEEADMILRGKVTAFERIPLSLDQDSRVVEYRVRLSLNLTLEEPRTNKILWKDAPWNTTAEYLASNNTQVERANQDRAIREASRRLAIRLAHQLSAASDAP